MTPYEQASELYRQNPQFGSFDHLLTFHLKEGVVMSGPHVFLMARQVSTTTIDDTWFIECGVGSMEAMITAMPFWLPFIQFARKGRLKVYATATLVNRILRDEPVENGHADPLLRGRRGGQGEATGASIPHVCG